MQNQNEEIKNMSKLKPRITENGIDYILVGDYYIPDLCELCKKVTLNAIMDSKTS